MIPCPGDSEVGHLHRPVTGEHDVARLHIPVDDAQAVGCGQGQDHLAGYLHRPAGMEGPSVGDEVSQTISFHQLHHHEIRPFRFSPVIDAHDVGMIQIGRGLRFAAKSPHEGLVL